MSDWTVDDIPDQAGRTALVTGANSGLGLASAKALAAKGARVLLGCRSPERGQAALAEVTAVATGVEPTLVALDLSDLSSVDAAAEVVASTAPRLDLLFNNAGVMAVPQGRTADGFETQFGTNHLGHFALTGRLLPLLLAADAPRVVTTSSNVHKIGRIHWDDLDLQRRYGKWVAYCQSKLANLLFTTELDRQAREHGGRLLAVAGHPGYASTHLQAVGPELTGSRFMAWAMDFGNRHLGQPADAGALPQLRAGTDPAVRSGQYYGPDGIAERMGSPTLVKARKKAYDPAAARRLWGISVERTGVTYDWG